MSADPVLQELLDQGFQFKRPLLTAKEYWCQKLADVAAGIQTIAPWPAVRVGSDGMVSVELYEAAVAEFLSAFREVTGDPTSIRCFFTPEDLLYHFELHVDLIPLRSVCFDQFLSDIEGLWRLQLDELNAEADQCQRDAFAERLSVLGVPYARPGMHELDLHTLFYRFDVEPELWPTKESASYLGEPPQISIRGR